MTATEVEPDESADDRTSSERTVAVRQAARHAVSELWPVLLVVVVAVGFRLVVVNDWMPECTPLQLANRTTLDDCYALGGDASYFSEMSSNLAAGRGFTVYSYHVWDYAPAAERPPGFAVFLAALDVIGLNDLQQHRQALAVLGGVGVLSVGLLGWRLGGPHRRWSGLAAAVLAAVYPGFWMSDALYMSESLFVPFVAWTLLAAYRFWDHPTWANSLLLGAMAGLAWLVRGEAALILGFIVVGMVLFLRGPSFWRRVGLGAAACAVCIGMMAPWALHNLQRFEDDTILIGATGPAFALNSCDDVWYGDATGWYSMGCLNTYTQETIDEDGRYTDRGLRARASAYISENLGRYPVVAAIRVGRLFGVWAPGDTQLRNIVAEGRRSDWVDAQRNLYYGFVVAGVAGLVMLRRRGMPISPLIATILAVAASVATTFAIYRYRTAADVALIAASAVAVGSLLGRLEGAFIRWRDAPEE